MLFNTTSEVVSMKRAISLIAYTQNGREASSSACPERRLFDVGAQCRSSTISELRSRSSNLVGGDLLSQLGNERASLLAHELLVRVGPTHMECASDQRGKPQPWQAKASYPTLTLP